MNTADVIGAVWSPDDGRVGPSDLCAALAKGARAGGARIFEHTAVTGIQTQNNKITGVETSKGLVRCDAVALCSGLWSRRLAAMAGVAAPIWPCEHFYLLTKPVPGITGNLPTLSDHDAHLYIRDDSGGLLVGCFEPEGKPIDPERLGEDFSFQLLDEDWDHFEPMMLNAMHRLPVLAEAEVKMLLNGPESFTPDGAFMLGEAAETRGFFLGCGMNSVGVASGGGAGMALAHCIIHGHPPADLHEVDPKRFPDCFQSVEALSARVPEVLGKHYEISYPGRQMSSARDLRTTPLHARWLQENACFDQTYGWERPAYFGATREPALSFGKPDWFDHVAAEVQQAHTAAALFDQSTFGKLLISGPDAEAFLNRICANNMSRSVNRAIYTPMLNSRGGFASDLTALRLSDECYRLYVGTGAVKRDLAWLRRHLQPSERVTIKDETEDLAVIALMGPDAVRIATAVGAQEMTGLNYFQHGATEIAGAPVRAVRLSYVGESGWEITCQRKDVITVYDTLFEAGARPSGAYAQTSMRIEKRFLAYGHDIDNDITPLEADLTFVIDWDKDFIGRDTLLKRRDGGVESTIATILFDDNAAVPLGNEPVYRNGEIIGKTSSAAYGYRIDRPVALAHLRLDALTETTRVEIDIAGERWSGTVARTAAYDPQGERMRNIVQNRT